MDILDRVKPARNRDMSADRDERDDGRSELFRMFQDIFSRRSGRSTFRPRTGGASSTTRWCCAGGSVYFTSDYMRSFPTTSCATSTTGTPAPSAERPRQPGDHSRDLQRCFQFLSFDENPRLLFDPDNKFEFSPRDADEPPAPTRRAGRKIPSTVSAIHAELTALRKRTVDLFGDLCCSSSSWRAMAGTRVVTSC